VHSKIWSNDPKVLDIDKSHLKKGKNVIAIRTVEDWSNDAFFGASGDMWIQVGDQKINLEGTWKFNNRIEPPYPKVVRYEHSPGTLFNAMINPVAGYTINGAIWYQGESNVNKNQYYKDLFMALIDEWRVRWNQGPFPFMYVQLANYQQRYDNPTDSDWAKLQEAQAQTLTLANTGMATAIDIGDAEDIHPRNKQDVGLRLWLQAKHLVYGENIIYSGPMYRGHVIKENKVEVSFDHVGKGLMQKNFDELVGFALAGEDQKFYWADAVIEGDRVILSAPEVPQPVAIRYGWADNPAVALYNKEGLPAVPFRTDRW
jgi:sialate O-acetylesterase